MEITNDIILYLAKTGCKFQYQSYDHKAAVEDYKINYKNQLDEMLTIGLPNCWYMPEELKDKYKVFKIGKLRSIEFAPNGKAWRMKIGSKYSKTCYSHQIGKEFIPILTKKTDKYKLKDAGLAIYEF